MAVPKPVHEESFSAGFDFPSPPDVLPDWAVTEGRKWAGLDDFSILVKAEEHTGKRLEVTYPTLSRGVWGFHVVKGNRGGIFVNSMLSQQWRRFVLFHELYHFLVHRGGTALWSRTATPLSSFESQADFFAWAVLLEEGACWNDATP